MHGSYFGTPEHCGSLNENLKQKHELNQKMTFKSFHEFSSGAALKILKTNPNSQNSTPPFAADRKLCKDDADLDLLRYGSNRMPCMDKDAT